MRPGRNDPCPCGSGKKFKNCCIDSTSRPMLVSQGDETTALERLFHFLEAPRHHARMADSIGRIVPKRLFEIDDEEAEEEIQSTLAETLQPSLFQALDDLDEEGRSLCHEFLASRDARDLSPFEREYLERLLPTYLGLYEVVAPDEKGHERVRECVTGEVFTLRQGDRDPLARFEILLIRLVPRSDGLFDTEGMQLVMPTPARDEYVDLLKSLREDEEFKGLSEIAFRKAAGALLYRAWIDSIHPEEAPEIDGDEDRDEAFEDADDDGMLSSPTSAFMIHDTMKCLEALSKISNVEAYGDSGTWFVYVERTGTDRLHKSRTLARIRRAANLMLISSSTPEDLARVVAAIEPAIDSFAARIDSEDGDMPSPADDADNHDAEDHDPEECDVCSGTDPVSLESLKAWADTRHPGLRGKTPREALADPSLRTFTIALARELEREIHQQEIDRKADPAQRSSKPFEFSVLADLGLDPNDPK